MKSGANYSISCLKIKSISKHSFSFGLPFFFCSAYLFSKLSCFLFVCLFVQFQATRNGWGFRGSRFQTIGWYAQKTFVQLLIFDSHDYFSTNFDHSLAREEHKNRKSLVFVSKEKQIVLCLRKSIGRKKMAVWINIQNLSIWFPYRIRLSRDCLTLFGHFLVCWLSINFLSKNVDWQTSKGEWNTAFILKN